MHTEDVISQSYRTADRLLHAALELADKRGLDYLTVRRIAEQAGVSPAAMHYHFSDKFELIERVIALAMQGRIIEIRSAFTVTIQQTLQISNHPLVSTLVHDGFHSLWNSFRSTVNRHSLIHEAVAY